MRFERAAGVLLHPTSLPSRYGIGDLGPSAHNFVDFLIAAKQRLWQTLPLGPTGYADSPYQSFSSFAGNPLLISPDKLVADGYLPGEAVAEVPSFPTAEVDYGPVIDYKQGLLRQAYEHFRDHGTPEQRVAYAQFRADTTYWLDDFALFMALKAYHMEQDGGVWNTWPGDIARREPKAVKTWSKKLGEEIENYRFQQFLFFNQWLELKAYANNNDIRIIGDMPIFVAYDSADVWAHPELFYLDETGAPTVIAGVPPDYFSATGQRWGNPLYKWDAHAATGYQWWKARLATCFVQADIVRIDHFRGFAAYWEIPAEEPTAVVGRWVKGPGQRFFDAIGETLADLPIIAEDLGVITPDVEALRDDNAFPGMKVLQFAFGGDKTSGFLPFTYDKNSVVYTGTHDNETTLGWYRNATDAERDHARRYMSVSGQNIVWDLIRLAHASVADMAVIPLQDLLVLGNEARMNFPGKTGGWWRWRFTDEMARLRFPEVALGLSAFADLYGRVPLAADEKDETTLAAAAGAADATP
jgi:4-alpha-glucanotransferase